MSKHELEGKFNPKDFEDEIYENWEKKGYFKPSNDKSKKPYTIVIPPPNITGRLHMGHALDETLQDILIRYKRMAGFNALWVPGTDHASIATEAKIVAKLKEEGITKEDLGREEFLKRAWDWKKEYGGIITKQIRKLGSSCDWSRERFTLDEGLSNAVQTVFINLYNKGLIYRGERMINWCPTCHTSISDSEVEYEQEPTHLWHIKYPIKGEEGKYLIVATTRPETMLGDTGVAVNPKDERYKAYIGKTVMLPIVGREIPIIAADFVETEFGTGAVKLTPAHDVNDYQAGLDNNLEMIKVFDENGNEMIYARGKNGVITNKEVEQAMMFYTTFGMNQEDARKQAVLYVEEREALYQQAIEAGYTVTDQEVYDYLEKLKVFIEQSDNKEDAMAIIEQFDSEEDYWNYEFEVYKKDLPIQKYMAAKEKEFKEVAPQAKSINEIEEEWQDYYEQIKAQAVENEEFKVVD